MLHRTAFHTARKNILNAAASDRIGHEPAEKAIEWIHLLRRRYKKQAAHLRKRMQSPDQHMGITNPAHPFYRFDTPPLPE